MVISSRLPRRNRPIHTLTSGTLVDQRARQTKSEHIFYCFPSMVFTAEAICGLAHSSYSQRSRYSAVRYGLWLVVIILTACVSVRRSVTRLIRLLCFRKGVSFLSRFIGTKKKGFDGADDASEAGERRPEGMNAQLFSYTVDNLGFSPKQPPPPAYIKVRTKYKKDGEFNRVFLAQELRTSADRKAPPAAGSNPAPQSGAAATHNPIWATEFSKDGRYLAAGGQDRIVRVWAVISTPEERTSHEKDEKGPGDCDTPTTHHLSAPVFHQKPYREYQGHTATVLDLSWSKVRSSHAR